MNPQFPIYIPSKGRWESRHTMKALDAMSVPYYVIVEPQEFKRYAAVIDRARLLVLEKKYKRDYDTFDKDEAREFRGPGPARNMAWDHAVSIGARFHWVADDNIYRFQRMNRNEKTEVKDGTILRCMEDWVLRYQNIAMAGPNYETFFHRKTYRPPFVLNTRVYSCNLIRNDVPFRWRGRYNEDTDLSLRMLKAGWCTVLFNAFLQKKIITQQVKGGNTDTYMEEGTANKSRMLVDMHPDVARIAWRFKRAHHYVDYSRFTTPLVRDESVPIREGVDEYGMRLIKKTATLGRRQVPLQMNALD